jgi:hypothetical protein
MKFFDHYDSRLGLQYDFYVLSKPATYTIAIPYRCPNSQHLETVSSFSSQNNTSVPSRLVQHFQSSASSLQLSSTTRSSILTTAKAAIFPRTLAKNSPCITVTVGSGYKLSGRSSELLNNESIGDGIPKSPNSHISSFKSNASQRRTCLSTVQMAISTRLHPSPGFHDANGSRYG